MTVKRTLAATTALNNGHEFIDRDFSLSQNTSQRFRQDSPMIWNRYFQAALDEPNVRALLIIRREAQTFQRIYNFPTGKIARQFHANCSSGSCSK